MAILELVAESKSPLGVSAVSDALSLPLATAHRQLGNLVAAGMLVKDGTTNLYALGERSFRLAHAVSQHLGFARGREILTEINQTTTYSTLAGKLVGKDFVYVENLPSTGFISVRGDVGARGPLHATSIGKALLSTLTEAEYDALVGTLDLTPYTPQTITDRARLDDEIAAVRERGYAQSDGEYEPQVGSISVPVRIERDGQQATYAVCIASHISEIAEVISWASHLRDAAERMKGLM